MKSFRRIGYSTIVLSVMSVAISYGADIASDTASDPAYASGFTTGTNGGSGFGPWNIAIIGSDANAKGGSFISSTSNDAVNQPPPVFDIWNDNTDTTGGVLFEDVTTATRPFNGALNPNQVFSFTDVLANGNPGADGGSYLGWALQDSSGNNLMDFRTGGGLDGYFLTDNIVNYDTNYTSVYYNYHATDKFTFILNDSSGDYSLTVTGANVMGGVQSLTGQIDMSTGGPSQFAIYDDNGGGGSDIQFNNLIINAPGISKWAGTGSGDWNNAGNWAGTTPNAIGNEADFFTSIATPQTVYTNTPITLGTLHFNNTSTYVLTGAGSLTMQAAAGADALVQVDQGMQEINLPLTIASNTTFNVADGATLLIANPITVNAGTTLTQSGGGTVTYQSLIDILAGGSMTFGNSSIANSLTLGSSASATIASHAGGSSPNTLTVYTLSLGSQGKLDLANNVLTIAYGSNADPISTVQAELKSGYDNGAWDGSGIISSTAAATRGTTLGYEDTGSAITIMYTWYGDLDLSGVVDSSDLAAMKAGNGTSWSQGDLNYDGVKNADDWALFDLGAAVGTKNISLAPEPGVLAMFSVALILSGARCRRRR